MKKINKNIGILIAIITICTILFSGCIGDKKQISEQVLTTGNSRSFQTIDPHKSGWLPLRLGITETLVDVDDTIGLVPGLAETWEVSDDKLTWTFHLRKDVKFHDGTPFNAYAMKSSLDRILKEATFIKKVPIDSIGVRDDYTLMITTKEPFAPLPAYLTKGESVPISNSSFNDNDEIIKPVGTGPFKFESWKVKEEIVVVKNDDYWSEKPKLDKVIYKVVLDAITRLMMLKGGELDIAQILPPDAIKQLESNPDIQILTKPITRVRMVAFNTQKAPFDDMKVRQAISYGINRDDLIKYVLYGIGEPAKGIFPPIAFWANKDIKVYPYDIDKARQLLAEAGWKDTDGNGILDKNGKEFKTILVAYPEDAEIPPMAEVIQSQLKKIGIEVELKILPLDAANELRNKGEFDMFLVARGVLFVPDPDDNMMMDYHSDHTFENGWGAYKYKNDHVDELLEKGRVTFNINERKKIYDEIQEIIIDDAPVIYLNYFVNIDAVAPNIHNYKMHPTEQSFHLETTYIE